VSGSILQPPERPPSVSSENPEQDLRGALHDVANALTVVMGCLDLALRQGSEPTAWIDTVSLAQLWARQGRQIALRAMGASRLLGAEGPQDLRALVRSAVAGVQTQASGRGVTVQATLPAEIEAVQMDAWPIALQVLTNLLFNAVAFTEQGTSVSVEASLSSGAVRLTLSDQGPGISPELRPRVFNGLPSAREGGMGIGLRYSRALTRSHGGTLALLEAERGACFELTWPLASDDEQPRAANPSSVATLSGKRVLVVDDDAAVLLLLETGLEARGAQVASARDAPTLTKVLASGIFDAALVDLSPLGDDPSQALRSIRAGNPSLRIVLISGSATPPPQEAMCAASAWVRKPFELSEIVAALLDGPAA
jgi:CheY-like chemotaxis protein